MNTTTITTISKATPVRAERFIASASSGHPSAARRRTPLFIHIAAWSVPVLVLGQFSMFAILPVAAIVIGSLVSPRARTLRSWAGLLGVVYSAPLAIWILRPDGAQSLSQGISPVFVGLIVAVSVMLLLNILTRGKR